MKHLGIDNGLNGGLVLLGNDTDAVIAKTVMPTIKIKGKRVYDVYSIVKWFREVIWEEDNVRAILEEAHVRPVSGKRACFMTGFGYGGMQFLLESLGIGYEIIRPQTWMKELDISGGDTKGSILFCQRKWPKEDWTATEKSKKPHDGLTDAACIALYGFRRNKNG